MYDRTLLRTAAIAQGQHSYVDLAHHLKVAPATGWRLWHGKTVPAGSTAAKVETAYGITMTQLLLPAAGS
ncbi:XRE family transcriptional regulator [Streptomyces sp. WAC01280]|uniref:XRE family transcriptional regulator n=1 Tax=Streptomyces sp. WAC01280 TaxID=2487424 RepID=UPI000F7A155F|nr:XRE family transcriptional regulator [Streptomyces sp. WAC01280]RSS51396.1 XRE family transcriptional regulator [Streptomyces sp. WAC01280]